MSKKMTPCEKLGYKVGDKFVMKINDYHKQGKTVFIERDDGTDRPIFSGLFVWLSSVNKVAKLKPAKQALADAIHQNGGWHGNDTWLFSTQSGDGVLKFWKAKPKAQKGGVCTEWSGGCRLNLALSRVIQNWHQTILSRDEYFTAYPEQVKVEVDDETERKAGVEMKSESEATINASDWHKNGELPPVGEVCEAYIDYPPRWIETEIVAHKDGFAIGWCKSVMKGCHGDKAHEFRQIRTEREKAIDEMVCEFIDHHGDPKGGERYLGIAAKLYDAGYRKEVK